MASASGSERVLTPLELNRATLARQSLLARESLGVVEGIERLCAIQAQHRASPSVALWSRLRDFRTEDLDDALRSRRVVKATLMRATLHLVSADDYVALHPAIAPSLAKRSSAERRQSATIAGFDALAEATLAYLSTPRPNAEVLEFLAERAPGVPPADLWWRLRLAAPLLVAPTETRFSFGPRPLNVAAGAWLERPFTSEEQGMEHLALRYLAAFGPATPADLQRFTRIEVTRIRPTLERLAPRLVRYRDEQGRVLYDVPGAPLPDPTTPAPPRFLPMWDSTLLAYVDGDRMLSASYRGRVVQVNGDYLPTFLIDGKVAGLWWAESGEGGTAVVRYRPFEPLDTGDQHALADEAERLAAFLAPLDPALYRTYIERWSPERDAERAARRRA